MLRLILLVAALVIAGCESKPQFTSTDITGADYGNDFALTDHTGKPRTLADYRGKVVVMFFGYTQCPDVCPTTMTEMVEVMKQLGDDAQRVQVLFVTVDPERDTQQLLAEYVPAFHPSFVGLYSDPATIARTAQSFRVFYQKQPGSTPNTYSVDHSAGSYVFDPQGRLRLYLRYQEKPEIIAGDLKTLLAEEG